MSCVKYRELINKEAIKYFESMKKQEQEKFIIARIKRSKAFKEKLNPKQKETLFSCDENGKYVYLDSTTKPNIAILKPTPQPNIFMEIQALLRRAESAFRANALHFCRYGIIHRYKKQILKIKHNLDSLKHTKFKGLENLRNAILTQQSILQEEQKILSIYQKMLNQLEYSNQVLKVAV